MKKTERISVWNKYGQKCAYCGEPLEYKAMQVDHIHPKHLGGKDDTTNYNPSCRACNFYKDTFSIDEFRDRIATLRERLDKQFIVRLATKYGMIEHEPFTQFYFETIP